MKKDNSEKDNFVSAFGNVKSGTKQIFLAGAIISVITCTLFFAAMVYPAATSSAFYSFSIGTPEEVVAKPGDTVTVDGTILVTGWWWLHDFNLSVKGLDYNYEITPQQWEEVRILREWNPDAGLYRVPEKFQMTINVPQDAYGVHIVTITGQEHHSFREISNSTFFALKVSAEEKQPAQPAAPELAVSDILVPEKVEEGMPFNITFLVNNKGNESTVAEVSILLPAGWNVSEKKQALSIKANDSAAGRFAVTPSDTAGEVSLYIEYPYKQTILNLTRIGPFLKPTVAETTVATTTTVLERAPFESLIESIKDAVRPYIGPVRPLIEPFRPFATPVTIGIVVVLLIVIVWLLAGIAKHYAAQWKEKKPTKETKEAKQVRSEEHTSELQSR